MQPRKWLCPKEAASYAGLAKSTLDKMRVYGRGPCFSKVGRRVLYDPAALDAFLAQNERRSTSDNGPEAANAAK